MCVLLPLFNHDCSGIAFNIKWSSVNTTTALKVNRAVCFIVSWSQPLHLKKLNDSKVNVAFEGIIISFTLHSESGCNAERWSAERHNVPYFRATEQLVQLTERDRERQGDYVVRERERKRDRERERERGKGGRQGLRSGDKTMYTACTCCLKNNRKGFALNDSEERWNIYWGETFMYALSMNSLLCGHIISWSCILC